MRRYGVFVLQATGGLHGWWGIVKAKIYIAGWLGGGCAASPQLAIIANGGTAVSRASNGQLEGSSAAAPGNAAACAEAIPSHGQGRVLRWPRWFVGTGDPVEFGGESGGGFGGAIRGDSKPGIVDGWAHVACSA